MSIEQPGEFQLESSSRGDQVLMRDELDRTATAIVPGGVQLNIPASEGDSPLRWRSANWSSKLAFQSDTPPTAIAVVEPTEVMRLYPAWSGWVIDQATQQLDGMTRYYARGGESLPGTHQNALFVLAELVLIVEYAMTYQDHLSVEQAKATITASSPQLLTRS